MVQLRTSPKPDWNAGTPKRQVGTSGRGPNRSLLTLYDTGGIAAKQAPDRMEVTAGSVYA